ncbi:DUF2716 domain-containing protein [Paenibacillus wynnii]|uniref:DUF2716 domain-containing protein n=1 Tax=Paenibacillus wynnii TaxID=268407 RepID=UPI002792F8A8|nr:DUF2716 domain-containing protein [Paenibacillus wynnii]MDQ0194585.1 hypothetical protein [Paenibacillus wynnii]
MNNWISLQDDEYRIVWNNFYKHFSFKPSIYPKDWQHESFYYSPYLQDVSPRISFYPDGDYYLFLKTDFSFGYLGHPWEHSITIFGEELIQQFIKHKPKILGGIIRRGR